MKIDEEIIKAWEELKKKKLKEKEGKKGRVDEEGKGEGREKNGVDEKKSEERSGEGKKGSIKSTESHTQEVPIKIRDFNSSNIESSEMEPPILISEPKKEQERLEEKAFEGTFKGDVRKEDEKGLGFYENETFYEYEITEISEISKELDMEPAKIEKLVIKDSMQKISENMKKEAKLIEISNEIIETREIKPEELIKKYEYDKYKSIKLNGLETEKVKKYKFLR